jgi:hypothetical protein
MTGVKLGACAGTGDGVRLGTDACAGARFGAGVGADADADAVEGAGAGAGPGAGAGAGFGAVAFAMVDLFLFLFTYFAYNSWYNVTKTVNLMCFTTFSLTINRLCNSRRNNQLIRLFTKSDIAIRGGCVVLLS